MFAIDTETTLVPEDSSVPDLVCFSVCYIDEVGVAESPEIFDRVEALDVFSRVLTSGDVVAGHNLAFDIAVLVESAYTLSHAAGDILHKQVWDAYESGRLVCTMVGELLTAIASGKMQDEGYSTRKGVFTLQALSEKYLGIHLAKEDTWRLRYGELLDLSLASWPREALDYALLDAETTAKVAHVLLSRQIGDRWSEEIGRQSMHAYALHLQRIHGVQCDRETASSMLRRIEAEMNHLRGVLDSEGLLQLKKGEYSRNMSNIRTRVCSAFGAMGLPAPRTDPSVRFPEGQIATDSDVIAQAAKADAALAYLTAYTHKEKIITTYLRGMSEMDYIHPRWNVLVATGRTSCSTPNLQNLPRGEAIRDCIIAREGYVFCILDYVTAELCTLAQTCVDLFGFSRLGDAINAGVDPHAKLGATLMGVDYSKMKSLLKEKDAQAKEFRQIAKAANFGYPGGLGPATFLTYAQGMGVNVPKRYADPMDWSRELRHTWLQEWPEMDRYFSYINKHSKGGIITQIPSGRVRGGVTYTSAANTLFQGRTADGAKRALSHISRECYVGESLLRGCRPVLFVHDEFVVEVPDKDPHLYAKLIEDLACKWMNVYTPDVNTKAETKLAKRWYKQAEPVYTKEGNLTLWEPKNAQH